MRIKGVIVAAGYGSRFLPATKTVAKELLPLMDRPSISFIVDEFLEAGIEDILIISSRRKKGLEDFFDREIELEQVFRAENKLDKLDKIAPPKGRFHFVRQQVMKGTGHALLLAEPFVGDDPFVVAYPDDIVLCEPSLSAQLVSVFRQQGLSLLAVQDLSGEDVSRYGVVAPKDNHNPCRVEGLVEKPPPGTEPSSLVSYGRYLFTAELFPMLREEYEQHQGGEYYHVPALNRLAAIDRLAAYTFSGQRLDTGEPLGYLESMCRYALSRPEFAAGTKSMLLKLAAEMRP